MNDETTWFARHRTARQAFWVAVVLVVVLVGDHIFGSAFVKFLLVEGINASFGTDIEVPPE